MTFICMEEIIGDAFRVKRKNRSHRRLFFSRTSLLEGDEEIIEDGWIYVRGEKMLARFKLGGFLGLRWYWVIEKEHE